jgi:putative membrane protein insertion efficiency factor
MCDAHSKTISKAGKGVGALQCTKKMRPNTYLGGKREHSQLLRSFAKLVLIKSIQCYQKFVSPLLGPRCRFYPSCSNYLLGSVEKYGLAKGIILAGWRLLRCHPLSKGGIDLP